MSVAGRRRSALKPLNDRVLPHDPNMYKCQSKMFLLLVSAFALLAVADLARPVRESLQGGLCDELPSCPSPERRGQNIPNWGGQRVI